MRDNKFNIKGVIMISSATIESTIDKIQILSIVPGPQKPYIQLLTGEAGFVGSLGDLISKYSQHESTKNDYLDVVQDIFLLLGQQHLLSQEQDLWLCLQAVLLVQSII